MSDVKELEALLTDQPVNPMRPEQRRQYADEMGRLAAITQAPSYIQGDRGEAAKMHRKLKGMVDSQIAKPLGERANRVKRLVTTILADTIQPAMLPQAVMRRNPPGAVDAFMKRENSPPVKRAVLAVKRALFALDPETDDLDHANLEKYRPSGINPDGTSTWDAAAQIPGHLAMTPLAKEHWPLGAATTQTALDQVRTREAALRRRNPPMSPEARKAFGEKMKAARAAKKDTPRGAASA